MSSAEAKKLIKSLRLQLLFATLIRILLLAVVCAGLLGAIWEIRIDGRSNALWASATVAAIAWVILTIFSVRQVRASNRASTYIASGRLDLAQEQLKQAMRQFSLYRNGKVLACHNLAVVSHGQKRYRSAAILCDGILSLGGRLSRHINETCRILLADCRLLLGDPDLARIALGRLSAKSPELALTDQLLLLPIELRCQLAMQQYQEAAADLSWKVQRAELLDSPKAALTHALLAAACRKTGHQPEADFLERRARLYHDLDELSEEYEILRNSALKPTSADNR